MEFSLEKSLEILENTPKIMHSFLSGLSDEWIHKNEGNDTWSPYDILGHLIHGEKTDWVVRANIILRQNGDNNFEPFDRFAQFEEGKGKSIIELLKELQGLRVANLTKLRSLNITESDWQLEGTHPEFGAVTLKQLLATWVVHDLGHIAQISRVMAYQYKSQVGPWRAYLRILNS